MGRRQTKKAFGVAFRKQIFRTNKTFGITKQDVQRSGLLKGVRLGQDIGPVTADGFIPGSQLMDLDAEIAGIYGQDSTNSPGIDGFQQWSDYIRWGGRWESKLQTEANELDTYLPDYAAVYAKRRHCCLCHHSDVKQKLVYCIGILGLFLIRGEAVRDAIETWLTNLVL
ncbi:hypothetical protein BJ508DRAFT_334972 [Ascobolus immersus RN42]|uniref:Uncharacterized protein n=1 Tax=Ascobolus immersus RN42 TaxID=1160509 RepID=A0A3N4HS90_ASCIM|nr:hypothetical protein BJ508DRAFT_334972 [Ascobolus immersus RN42]